MSIGRPDQAGLSEQRNFFPLVGWVGEKFTCWGILPSDNGQGVAVAGLFWEGGNARGIAGTLSATRELASMGSALLCSWCLTKLSVNATSPTPKSQVKSTNLCFLVQKICTNFCTNLYFSVLISVPICVS